MKKETHPIESVKSSLEIEEHIGLHKTGWKMQSIGFCFIYLFIILAALGTFGNGVFSKKNLQTDEAQIEYQKFYRFEAPMELKFRITDANRGTFISLPIEYAHSFEMRSILPEPKRSRFESNAIQYFFEGENQMEITFYLIPQKFGSIEGMVTVNNSNFELEHFIYP